MGKLAGALVGVAFLSVATHTLTAVGGWQTSLRVGAVTVVPLFVLLQLGPRVTSGLAKASPVATYLRLKIAGLVFIGLLLLPLAFTWTGNSRACYHASAGGAAGLVLGFVAFYVFVRTDRRNLDWMTNHRLGWRFFYRATASVFVMLGAAVGLALV